MQNDNKSPLCNTDYTAVLCIMQEIAKFVKKCMIFLIFVLKCFELWEVMLIGSQREIRRREADTMVNIVLVEPEIPHNTGAIARTCAATGARLHLIKPLGFDISDKAVKRCGLDYWYLVDISVYENIDEYFAKNGDSRLYLATHQSAAGVQ